jgi:SAM-dependent methyltransferase
MLALARGITEGRSRLAQASVESLPFPDGAFDVVCTAGVFEYLPADRAGLRELRRVLAPGGWLLFPITNLWSPAGYLDFAVEFLKRRKLLLDVFNTIWARNGRTAIRPRYFPVRKQRPSQIRSLLRESDFELHRECYFHFLGLPHPVDRLLPRLSNALERRLEGLASTPLRGLGEGWLSVSRAGEGRSLGTNG